MANNVFLGEQAAHMIAHGIDEIISKNKVNYHLTEDGSGIQIDGGFGEINIFGIDYNNLIETVKAREYIAKENCYVEITTYANDNRQEEYYVNGQFLGYDSINGECQYLKSLFLTKGDTLTFREGVSHVTTIRVFGLYNTDIFKNENCNKHNYSTEEQIVGTWIDGKPIYEKTFQTTITDVGSKEYYSDVIIEEADKFWIENMWCTDSNGCITSIGMFNIHNQYDFNITSFNLRNGRWWLIKGDYAPNDAIIIVRYTKTTD